MIGDEQGGLSGGNRLKYGNPAGDPLKAPRCGAKTGMARSVALQQCEVPRRANTPVAECTVDLQRALKPPPVWNAAAWRDGDTGVARLLPHPPASNEPWRNEKYSW